MGDHTPSKPRRHRPSSSPSSSPERPPDPQPDASQPLDPPIIDPSPADPPPSPQPPSEPPIPPESASSPSPSSSMALLHAPQAAHDLSSAAVDRKGKARASSRDPPSTPTTLKRSHPAPAAHPHPHTPFASSSSGPAPQPSHQPAHIPPRQPAQASHLLPLLRCPLCPPNTLLSYPTTLLCGHTVCATHVTLPPPPPGTPIPRIHPHTLPSCPIPACRPIVPGARSITPAAGSSSQPVVLFHGMGTHAPQPMHQQPVIRVPAPRQDTLVASLMAVTVRTRAEEEQEAARIREQGADDHNDMVTFPSSDAEASDDEDDAPSPTHSPPPKRVRHHRHAPPPPLAQSQPSDSGEPEMTRFEKELLNEFACGMCYLMLYEPVTTPCQHTFCARCLQRSLDHTHTCPLCRGDLPGFAYFQDHAPNKLVLSLMLAAFPESYAERRRALEQEARDSRLDTPIFYSWLTFPNMPVVFHFFEPRYRLLLRRITEDATFRFGAISASRAREEGMDYGTMMEVKSVQMLPDGRALVETVGSWRFRMLERGLVDGYTMARIEKVEDYPLAVELEVERNALLHIPSPPIERSLPAACGSIVPSITNPTPATITDPSSESALQQEPTNEQLMASCHTFLEQLRSGSAPWVVTKLNTAYGDPPADPSAFTFWMAAVLPLNDEEKAKLLPIRSPRLRLRLIVHWIEQLNSNWWFNSGCVIG